MKLRSDHAPSGSAQTAADEAHDLPAPPAHRSTGSLNACDALVGHALARGLRDAPALIHREIVYSYGALEKMVNRTGHALKDAGIGKGDRVLFLLKDTPALVASFLAAMKVGGVAIALNTRYAAADLGYAIADAECRLMFIDAEFLPILEEAVASGSPRPDLVVLCSEAEAPALTAIAYAEFVANRHDVLESAPTSPDDMAFWVYTSGTTGKPKAVVHLHRDILIADRHLGEVFGLKMGDKLFSSSKLFFSFALAHCMLGGLRLGATLILDDRWPHTEAVAEMVARHRPDVVFSVPTIYRNLLNDGYAATEAFRAVRCFVSAGERLPPGVFDRWHEATGKPIFDGIGATETLFLFIANTPVAHRSGATGRRQPGVELRLLDEGARPVSEAGQLGVLWVRMDSVADHYWHQPDKTKASFDQGWYRTGDMFTFDEEGWWYHHGRSDDLFKVSGQWVSPTEIEDCALATPGVVDVAVVGMPNEDGLTRLRMFVVAAPGSDSADLMTRVQTHLKANLSIFKCPRNFHFIDEIPRTATGKIQRFRLRAAAEELASTLTPSARGPVSDVPPAKADSGRRAAPL